MPINIETGGNGNQNIEDIQGVPDFSGQSGNFVKVNSAEDGLEYSSSSGGTVDTSNLGLPYRGIVYQSIFDTSINGWQAFSGLPGGTVSHDNVNNRLVVGSISVSTGASYETLRLVENQKYRIEINITEGTGGRIRLKSRWNISIGDAVEGDNVFEYTQPSAAGSFGNNLLLSCLNVGESYVNSITIYEVNDTSLIYSKLDADESARTITDNFVTSNTELVYANDFTQNDNLVSTFGGTYTHNTDESKIEFTGVHSSQMLTFLRQGADSIDMPEFTLVELDVEIINCDVFVYPRWSNEYRIRLKESGVHFLFLHKVGDNSNVAINRLLLTCANADSTTNGRFNVKSIKVFKTGDWQEDKRIRLGRGAENKAYENGVIVGQGTTSDQNEVTLVGENINGNFNGMMGCAPGNEAVMVGEGGIIGGYRVTGIGAKSSSLGQSSTVVGGGSFSGTSHGAVFGRGGFLAPYPINVAPLFVETKNTCNLADPRLYLGNGWAHRFPLPPSGISTASRDNNNSEQNTNYIYGPDAFDARYPAYDAAYNYQYHTINTNAGLPDKCWYNGFVWYTRIDNNLGNTPSLPDWIEVVGDNVDLNWTYEVFNAASTYSQGDEISFGGKIWESRINSNLGNTPSLPDWIQWYADSSGAAADFEHPGGHLQLCGGRGTKAANGGDVIIATAVQDGTKGDNEKNDLIQQLKVSGENFADGTSLFLLDQNSNNLHRVKIGASGTGPGGIGRALYID